MELVDVMADGGEEIRALPGLLDVGFYSGQFFAVVRENLLMPDKVLEFCCRGVHRGFGIKGSGEGCNDSFSLELLVSE